MSAVAIDIIVCVSITVSLPRYVRANTLKTTVDAVIESFVNEGYLLVDTEASITYNECLFFFISSIHVNKQLT